MRLYALTDQGLFMSLDEGLTWDRLFDLIGSDEPLDEIEEIPDDFAEQSEESRRLTALAIDPNEPRHLYLASTQGLLVSQDGGARWQRATQLGLGTSQIRHLVLHAHSPTVVYAATAQGVARYHAQDQRWEVVYSGLPTHAVRFLASTETKIYAATDQGLYALDLTEEQLAQGSWPSVREILANFIHEPTIEQVRQAAILYAEVQPEKIQRWRRQAYMQAFLPTFSVGASPNLTDYRHWDSGTNPDSLLKGERDMTWTTSINWDLGDLIWSTDQTSIDVRSKLMVQLRDDIVDEVTRHYFERRRLQIELLTDPPGDARNQLDTELRLAELTAMIDGLTGGWFSTQLEHTEFGHR
jgi:hypothetical protein